VSGGRFYRARTNTGLEQVYKRLATRVGHKTESRQITDLFAGGAIVLLLAGGGLSAFWFRRAVP
jgi:Ca-activated chloride channel homolog